jgi:hypothetical protein
LKNNNNMLRRHIASSARLVAGPSAVLQQRRMVSKDEQEELNREARLRQSFVKGKAQSSGFPSFPGLPSSWTPPGGSGPIGEQPSGRARFERLYTVLVYFTCIYSIIAVWQGRDDQSPMSLTQGLPWWAVSGDTVVASLLSRVLLPVRKQRELQSDFSEFLKQYPQYNYAQFLAVRHPDLFSGNMTRQADVLMALVGAFNSSSDLQVATSIVTNAKRGGDIPSKIDAIAEGVRMDFPLAFAGMQQVQQPPVSQQQYVGGGSPVFYAMPPPVPQQPAGTVQQQQQQQQQPQYSQPPQQMQQDAMQQQQFVAPAQAVNGQDVTTAAPQEVAVNPAAGSDPLQRTA